MVSARTAAEALARSLAPETQWIETEDLVPNHPMCDCVGAHEVGCPMLDLPGAPLEVTVAPLVTAQYEPNPNADYVCTSPGKGKKAQQKSAAVGMPEAPASLNLKLRLPGGHELMYTMRSMIAGPGGDQELMERLPDVLEVLEGFAAEGGPVPESLSAYERATVAKGSWLRRLAVMSKLTGNGNGQSTF